MANKKNIKINKNDIIAKSSEIYISVKIGCLKFLDSYRFLDTGSDKLSLTLTSFPSLDENGMEDDLFKRKLAYPYEMTGVKLDYITDDKLRLLLENNMRGGPSACMGNCYVKRGERKIVYEDMTNLYGWSMSQYLPTGDFREIKVTRSSLKTNSRTPDNDEHGFLKKNVT